MAGVSLLLCCLLSLLLMRLRKRSLPCEWQEEAFSSGGRGGGGWRMGEWELSHSGQIRIEQVKDEKWEGSILRNNYVSKQ